MLFILTIIRNSDGHTDFRYAEIADIRQKFQLVVVMRDYAGENVSDEIKNLFTEKHVKNYFNTSFEPWQDGLGETGLQQLKQ